MGIDFYRSTPASMAMAPTAPTQNTKDHLIRSPIRRSSRASKRAISCRRSEKPTRISSWSAASFASDPANPDCISWRTAAKPLLVLVRRPRGIQRKERGGGDGSLPVLGPEHAAGSVITQGLADRRPHDRLDTPAPTVDQHVLRGEAMARHRALRDFPIPQFIAQRAQIAFPQLGNAGRATDAHGIVAVG